jgi:class 3 adenylate cyclase
MREISDATRPPTGTDATVRPDVRTFLIADVRGYTRYTLEHGDAAGASASSKPRESHFSCPSTRGAGS